MLAALLWGGVCKALMMVYFIFFGTIYYLSEGLFGRVSQGAESRW